MTWLYRQTSPGVYTVGFYTPDGEWEAESDHGTAAAAARRVSYLNGGSGVSPDDISAAALYLKER